MGPVREVIPGHMVGIITLLVSIVALAVSLVSVWFVSVMVKRANTVNRQFYEGNVRGNIKLMENMTKSMEADLRSVGRLEKIEKKDIEVTVAPRMGALEDAATEMRATIEALQKSLPGSPGQMF